jgi:membrane-bound inhibitor of C-type lysozyme
MKRARDFLKVLVGAVVVGTAPAGFGIAPAAAQSFQTYHCTDGSEFVVGFYPYDPRAFVQIDGRAVTLARRLTLSGRRYSGGDVTLRMRRDGATTIRHARRRETECQLD